MEIINKLPAVVVLSCASTSKVIKQVSHAMLLVPMPFDTTPRTVKY